MDCSMTKAIAIATMMTGLGAGLGCTPGSGTEGEAGTGPGDSSSSGISGSGTSAGPTTSPTSATSATGDTTGTPTATLDTSDDDPACTLPAVDEVIVGQLFIYGSSTGYVAAGESTSLSLAWIEFGFPSQVEACVAWSVDPVAGVSIDADGVLSVESEVPPGTIVSVTADLEDGRRLITADFEVYVPLESPLLGYWSEVEQLPCDGGAPFMPDPIIPELVFADTGRFTVTWTPFESYIDYWGTFVHDEGTGALTLTVEGGNYVPVDVDGEGIATVVDGVLTLEDMWLGTAQDPVTPPACGHVFE